MPTQERESCAIKITAAFPNGFKERNFLCATYAFLKVKADRNPSGATCGDVKPLTRRKRIRHHFVTMDDHLLLRESWTIRQIRKVADLGWIKAAFREPPFVVRTMLLCMQKDCPKRLPLIVGDLFLVPAFALGGDLLEVGISLTSTKTLGKLPITETNGPLHSARHPLI